MAREMYSLAGTVHIPEEKKDEFNRKVMTVLYRCGIRKTETVRLAGKDFTVVVPVRADSNGIAAFDYSVIEKKKIDAGIFNIETGELSVTDFGNQAFAFTMSLIMTLQQAYSDMPCLVMERGRACWLLPYRAALNTITGEETVFRNGTDVWENMLLLHRNPEYGDIEPMEAYRVNPYGQAQNINRQNIMAFLLMNNEIKPIDEGEAMNRERIPEMYTGSRKRYAYRLLMMHQADPEFEAWLKHLLDSEWQEREQISLRDDDYGIIAELSRYLPSQAIASLYANSRKEAFWDVWDRLEITGYSDIPGLEEELEEDCNENDAYKTKTFPFYVVISKKSEDEFLDLWNGDNLKLSDELIARMEQWKDEFRTAEVPPDFEMEDELAGILEDMKDVWNCRYVDRAFVEDFLEHRNDERYKKLIMVLRNMLDEDTSLFPELTKKQAAKWIIQNYRNKYDTVLMAAFTSLTANKEQRKRIFSV